MGDDQQQHQGNGYQQGGNYQGNPQQNYHQQNYQQQNYQQQNYQQGFHNQVGNGNNWEGQHQQQLQMGQMYNRYNAPYGGNQQQGRGGGGGGGGGNYVYANQQQETNDYYGYEGAENFDQDDYENLEAIERAISGSRVQSSPGDQYGEYADEEDRAMAELEEEMHRARNSSNGGSSRGGGASSGSYLPAGAVPRQNGVLSVHAKEFWFPESRNCSCCKGFKHGCDCCTGGVDTCAKGDCINAEFATQVATDLATRSDAAPSAVSHTAPAVRASAPAPAARATGSFLPPGAVPRQNGVLSVHAKEFWFPECRNCSCCKGFKHGCDCCAGGVDTCAKGDCINAEFATQVATDLASRTSEGEASAESASSVGAASITADLGNMSIRAPASSGPITHTSSGAGAVAASGGGGGGGGAPGDACKFFASGGCRFGDSCRFKHIGSAPAVPTPPTGVKPICPFFLSSSCQYGDSCRKSHDISGGAPPQMVYSPPGPGHH